MDFGKRLKEQLALSGMTQKELAEKVNTTQGNVSNWVTGRNEPTVKQLVKIYIALDTTPNELLDFKTD